MLIKILIVIQTFNYQILIKTNSEFEGRFLIKTGDGLTDVIILTSLLKWGISILLGRKQKNKVFKSEETFKNYTLKRRQNCLK